MADDIVYKVTLDETDVLKSLQNIDKNIQKLAANADKEFKGMGGSAKMSGVQIGAIAGIVSSLTTEFINLGKQAISTIIDISKRSVEIAIGFDTLQARLKGIFDGSEEAADQAFDFIQERSKALGIDLGELAGAFIPKTESLAQFERVAKVATALARSDPEQGAIGARIALLEALSGTFTSLQRRFEIPKQDIDRIKEAYDTEGIEGFISTLETVLAESGKSFEDLANTADTSLAKVQEQGRQLLGVFGDPIVAELKEQFDDLGSVLKGNEQDFELIVTLLGELASKAVEFIGSNFVKELSAIDPQGFIEIYSGISEIFDGIKAILDLLGLIPENAGIINSVVGFIAEGVNLVAEATRGWVLIIGVVQAGLAAITATIPTIIAQVQGLNAVINLAQGNVTGALSNFNKSTENLEKGIEGGQLFNFEAGKAAAEEAIKEVSAALDEMDKKSFDRQQHIDELLASLKDIPGTGAADAIMQQAAASREAEQAAEELQAALEQAHEKLADLEKDFSRQNLDIIIDAERKKLDVLQDFAQKRLDLARKNRQKIEDIDRDLNRDFEDINREGSRKRVDIDRDLADKKIDIERDYQRRISDIRRNFEISADDAARSRDAVAFLAAQRKRDEDLQSARDDRNDEIQDATTEAARRREELARNLEYEREDAAIAAERKLEDQRTALQREEEDLRQAEAQKTMELATEQNRRLADAKRHNAEKLADLMASLSKEVQAVIAAEKKKTEIIKQQRAFRNSLEDKIDKIKDRERSQNRTSMLGGRAYGGPVGAGQTVLVGERGLELFKPSTAGMVLPSSPAIMSPLMSSSMSNISNVSATVNQSLLDPAQQSAIMRAIAKNEALQIVSRILNG